MQYDMKGNIVPNEHIDTDRKFWKVHVTIISTVWESGYHIYEADSLDTALEMYHSEKETPHDIEYTGWIDQDYKYDELDEEDPEQLPSDGADVQGILTQQQNRDRWLAAQEKDNE
jgi:hypothetical protein